MIKPKRKLIMVLAVVLLLTSLNLSVFAEYIPGIPAAVDPGTPIYKGLENPVPEEPVEYDPSISMMEAIYNADLTADGDSFWVDRILERSGSSGGSDLFTRGRALYMYAHRPNLLGFAGGYAYRERPTGSDQNLYTISVSDTSLTEDTSQRKQYPSYWSSVFDSSDLNVLQKKFITYNNVAITVLKMTNTSDENITKTITATSPLVSEVSEENTELTGTQKARYDLTTMYPRLSGDEMVVEESGLTRTITLEPEESITFKVQMGVITNEIPESSVDYDRFRGYDADTAFSAQLKEYNSWWHENVPYVDIPDQNIKKMSYYRTFLSRYNYFDGNIPGNDYQFPVSIEGVLGYNNAIQLTQCMHMQDLKYFRNPLYSYGNWVSSGESSKYSAFTDNPGDPAHWNNTYEQYIAEEAWRSYKVHGGDFKIVRNLARYAEGDATGQLEKYDTNNNYLVQYDWGSLTGNDADANAFHYYNRDMERTDPSSFVYAGAKAAAEAYALLGENYKSEQIETLADNVKNAILDILWDDSEGYNGKVFKQKDVRTGNLIPWKDQQNWCPFTAGLVPDTDNYKQALRFYADKTHFPIMPFFTADQYDKAESGYAGSNNFSNINSTLQARLFAKAIREYPSEYITPEMYRKLIEWLTWTQYIEGDNRYPDNNEFWNSYDEENMRITYRSWIHHNILGAYNFSLIEDVAGIRPRLDDVLELWPIDMGYEYFTVNNLRYHDSDLTIVWDRPDGTKHYANVPEEGYSVYLDGQRVFTVDDLVHLSYDPNTGNVTILDDSEANVLYSITADLKKANEVSLSDNERVVDMFQKTGADISDETGSAINLAEGKDVSASYTSVGSSPEQVTAPEYAVDGFTVSGLPVKLGSYIAPNPIWGTKGSPNAQDWFEVDFGEETSFDNVKLYFYSDKYRGNYKEPLHYTIQYFDGTEWKSVPYQKKSPIQANYNEVMFNAVTAEKMRVLMTSYPGYAIGLKEIQVFETGIEVPIEPNQPPVVSIIQDMGYSAPMKARLLANISDDSQIYDYPEITWSKESGPGSIVFSDPGGISTVVSFTEEGTYIITLTAYDGEYHVSCDIEITVEMQKYNLALSATPSTSFVSSWEDLNAINNGIDPKNSRDKTGGAYGNWAHADTEWVQYTWPEEVVISESDVYWWTDGGGIQMPSSCSLEYLDSDGTTWKDVIVISGLGVEPDKYNKTIFAPVKTKALRMTINRGTQWTGILEWKVFEETMTSIYPSYVKVPVNVGEQPTLPQTIIKIFRGGITQEAGVTWDSIPDEELETGGTQVNIWGAVDSSYVMVPCTIYVRVTPKVSITNIAEENITTTVGIPPVLPEVVEVTYNDGSMDNINIGVMWEDIDPSDYSQVGEFVVQGSVEGTSLKAIANVSVTLLPVFMTVPKNVSTFEGVPPVMPETVTVVYEDRSTAEKSVVWDSIDESDYMIPGSFTVEGSIEGIDEKAICTVNVEAIKIISFDNLYITVPAGIAPTLPEAITANYNDGSAGQVSVEWGSFSPGDYAKPGSFNVRGTIEDMPSGVSRPRAYITVEEAIIVDAKDVYVYTEVDVEPVLPTVVTAVYSDSVLTMATPIWPDIDPSNYETKGNFTVTGEVYEAKYQDDYGLNIQVDVKAFVTVVSEGAVIASINEVDVTTERGIAPVLPVTVTAIFSDDSSGEFLVEWDDIDSSEYAQEGVFSVEGTVEGTDVKAVANITVIDTTIDSIDPIYVTTNAGVEPVLPVVIKVNYTNGTTGMEDVTWEDIDPSLYADEGNSFTVEGTVEGTDIKAIAYVTVSVPNLELWYKFDEETGDVINDVSGNQNHGVLTGNANWTEGNRNGGLRFDGSTYIDAGTSPDLQPSALTVSYWIKRTDTMDASNIFWAKPDAGWNGNGWYLTYDGANSSYLIIDGFNGFSVNQNINDFLPLNEWTNVVVTFDSETGEGAVYKNGAAQVIRLEGTPDSITSTDSNKYMGFSCPTYNNNYVNNAVLDDFRIYSKAMTEEEVQALYESTKVEIVSIDEVNVTTEEGTAPVLPETVTVTYSDDSTAEKAVVWDAIDPSKYAKAGTFTVEGTVEGTEIKAVASVTVSVPNLALWYKFDEETGDTINDASGNDNHGVLTGNANWTEGNRDGGLRFDGNTYVDAGTSPDLQPSALTVSYWIKRTDTMDASNIFWAKPDAGWNGNGWYLTYDGANSSYLIIDGFNGFSVNQNINDFLPLNEWTNVVVTFDSETGEGAVYKNGAAQVIRLEGTPDSITSTDSNKYMGFSCPTYNNNYVNNAVLDDFRIYSKAMTEEEVQALYESTKVEIVSIDEVNVTTEEGTAPVLPETVTVTYSDDSTAEKAVVWDAIDPSKYAKTGTFTVEGTVEGTSIRAVANVTVLQLELEIVSIDEVNVTTEEGTAPVLPETVTVTYIDDSTAEKAVVWDEIDPSKYAKAGTFRVEGTVGGTEIKAIANIIVVVPQPPYTISTTFNMEQLKAGGTLEANVEVTNNTGISDSVLVIAALYNAENQMENFSYIAKEIEVGRTVSMSAGFKLPADVTGYMVKVFVWDGTNLETTSMQPLSEVISLP